MKYSAYPAYKDSGVEWLGEIPEYWEAKRLKWVVSQIGSGKTPKGGGQIYSNSGVIFFRIQNIHFDGLRLEDVVYIDDVIDKEMASTRVMPQDVLLNITGASLGRCSIVPSDFPAANVNQHVCIIRPIHKSIQPSFLLSAIASNTIQAQIFSSENGTSREGLTFSQIANLVLAVPSNLSEQQAIASFLDRETAKIDALIAKKERLIELLQEKRLVCEGGEVGRTAIWQGELTECYFQKTVHRLRSLRNTEEGRFFFYVLYTAAKRGVFVADGSKNTIAHLTAEKLKKHRFAFPPYQEQQAIASYLDRETTKIDALIAKIREGIEKLKEYRTALISAAVTGKIDVRNEVAS